jgi:peptidyl-lysine (3S)-dioxygenase / protease
MIEASKEAIEGFVDDVQSLWLQSLGNSIPILQEPPTALEFLRDFVAVSRPCLLRNVATGALTLDALVNLRPDLEITVDVTPDGHGDCLRRVKSSSLEDGSDSWCFVQPIQRSMSLQTFQQKLRQQAQRENDRISNENLTVRDDYRGRSFDTMPTSSTMEESRPGLDDIDGVVYYSRQNDCLRTELSELWELLLREDSGVPGSSFAGSAPVLGAPAAVNLWIGNECAVSSLHKDYYENLYYVASGEKIMTLCPPSDIAFVYEQEYPSGSFVYDDNDNPGWKVRLHEGDQRVQWMGADVTLRGKDPRHMQQFPLLQYTTPITVHVQANEMIYIPALWLHHVTQSCETVAINYWYEMNFNTPLYAYFHLLQQMKPAIGTKEDDVDDPS